MSRSVRSTLAATGRVAGKFVGRVLVQAIRFYQQAVSPWKVASCRFRPTCSQYMIEAVERRGAVVGTALGAWRILRCNPFCTGGYDPVDGPGNGPVSHGAHATAAAAPPAPPASGPAEGPGSSS